MRKFIEVDFHWWRMPTHASTSNLIVLLLSLSGVNYFFVYISYASIRLTAASLVLFGNYVYIIFFADAYFKFRKSLVRNRRKRTKMSG